MDQRRLALISLNLEGITAVKDLLNIENYVEGFQNLWQLNESCLREIFPMASEKRKRIHRILKNADEYVEKIKTIEKNFTIYTIFDKEYPSELHHIYDPPYVLYIKGRYKNDIPLIAMVGARKASAYGKWAAGEFSRQLVQFGIGIVSGLAFGVDTASHQGALDADGYTIGVLGCGIDQVYPAANRRMYQEIEAVGTIISEYPPGTPPQKHFFPARNRIISGLSYGVFILEAGIKSGSLITAEFAMEQGKEIYALPGHINHGLSQGTNRLIQDGAKMVLKPEDIVDELYSKQLIMQNQRTPVPDSVKLSKKEAVVVELIRDKAISIDELVFHTGLPVSEMNSLISILELKGLIQPIAGKLFTSCP